MVAKKKIAKKPAAKVTRKTTKAGAPKLSKKPAARKAKK